MNEFITVETTRNSELDYTSALPNLMTRIPSDVACAKVFVNANTKLIPYLENKECAGLLNEI